MSEFSSFGEKESTFERSGAKLTRKLQNELNRFKSKENRKTTVHLHQLKAVLKTKEMFEKDGEKSKPVLIVAPKGSGKSGMIALLPYALQANKVLILTPSKVISEKLAETFGLSKKAKSFLEATNLFKNKSWLEPVKIIEKKSDLQENLGDLVIVNAQRFGETSSTSLFYEKSEMIEDVGQFFSQFDLLIVAEAHHYPAKTWEKIVAAFNAPNEEKKIVFITATPRNKNKTKREEASIWKDLQNRCAYKISADYLQKNHFIRKSNFINEGNTMYEPLFLFEHLEKYLELQEKAEPRFVPQAVVIVKTKKEAIDCEKNLNIVFGENYAVAVYSGKKKEMQDFTSGKYQVAVVCSWDNVYRNPKVTLCVIMRNIGSQLLFSRFIGTCMKINTDLEGDNPDQSKGIILSFPEYNQVKMWKQWGKIPEGSDHPTEENEEELNQAGDFPSDDGFSDSDFTKVEVPKKKRRRLDKSG